MLQKYDPENHIKFMFYWKEILRGRRRGDEYDLDKVLRAEDKVNSEVIM